MKARLLGPFLMMALGAALLGGSLLGDPLDVGTVSTTTTACSNIGNVEPCPTTTTTDPCPPLIGAVSPCPTSTTMAEETTTTVVDATTTPTDPAPTTTASGGVLPADDDVTPQPAPNPANGELARTGRDELPLTVAGVTLVVLGAGLAVAGRRHRLQAEG